MGEVTVSGYQAIGLIGVLFSLSAAIFTLRNHVKDTAGNSSKCLAILVHLAEHKVPSIVEDQKEYMIKTDSLIQNVLSTNQELSSLAHVLRNFTTEMKDLNRTIIKIEVNTRQ